MHIVIIGGGAAGFFSAIHAKTTAKEARVTLLEKTSKVLSKVRISGGGRCNVTHACFNPVELSKFYPRGERFLKKAFGQFQVQDTIDWYTKRDVVLKTEEDGRMFPNTDDSETIAQCLEKEIRRLNIDLRLNTAVKKLIPHEKGGFQLELSGEKELLMADKVIVTTGGTPKKEGLMWLNKIGLETIDPVPSLFTFNIQNDPVKKLMGLSVPQVNMKVRGTKLKAEGPVLITHWGMSGPAVLRLSAWGARELFEKNYDFVFTIDWINAGGEDQGREAVYEQIKLLSKRKISNKNPWQLPQRLWDYLLNKLEINPEKRWGELNKKEINKLGAALGGDSFQVKGKTTFKEEFVTCGGIKLSDINVKSMESKKVKGLYFAGEILDIDGITGGFNFQAAWTTAFIAGRSAANSLSV